MRWRLADVLALPAREFGAWMSFYAVEPWGLADQLLNAIGDKPPQVSDFDAAMTALKGWADG